MRKDRIIELLGEERLLLPRLISAALEANDRVKYLLALLQSARAAADGAAGVDVLHDERLASGLLDPALDRVVPGSGREPDGRYRIPGAADLVGRALDETARMLTPLQAAGLPAAVELEGRRRAIAAAVRPEGDRMSDADIVALCAGPGEVDDSLHLVVMEAHHRINELAAQAAPESIDGARAYELGEPQRQLVRAFMRGVHSTERLKLDHPGLETLAMAAGADLVIQNDLGTTDAHVLVLKVSGTTVTVTYTDVHLERLLFFQHLLEGWRVEWEDTRSRSDTGFADRLFHLAVARLTAADAAELEGFLAHLGSRLVFIIDWNRARKRLRRLVGNRSAIDLLRWAADHDLGHMAFLHAGADELVYGALEFAGAPSARAGESLRDVLGAEAAERYLRSVLRICSDELMAGGTVSLVQDEVAAELIGYLRSARQELHELALRHAETEVEIVEAARDGVEQAILGAIDRRQATAERAERAEQEADGLVTQARAAATRAPDLGALLGLVQAADDIADSGEEAAFYATLLPAGAPAGDVRVQVRRIARLVLAAARAYLRAVHLSGDLHRGGPRQDMDAFLAAVHRTIELERETDAAQRGVHRALAAGGADTVPTQPTQFVVVELTRAFEETSDALMHCAHLLREHTLAGMVRAEPSFRRLEPAPAPSGSQERPARSEHVYVLGDPAVPVPDAAQIGGKAHGLARMSRAGLRIPEGVALTTGLWRAWRGSRRPEELLTGVLGAAEQALCAQTGARFADPRRPLLLSVRSGAPTSMPGMLETVLDVGLCDAAVGGLVAQTGNPTLAWDCYRRLVESYAAVVHGVPHAPFAQALGERLQAAGADSPRELPVGALRELTAGHLELFAQLAGRPFPQDPREQLTGAVRAVLGSWEAAKAQTYRRLHAIPESMGTAVILQRMVFGNAGGVSGAGVGFTRDPAIGDPRLYLDFLFDAQGEDVVGGRQMVGGVEELAVAAPQLLAELEQLCPRLEAEFGDAQEFELTVEEGRLYLLQTRTAKRTPWAALRIAADQVRERLISPQQGLDRLRDVDLDAIRRRRVAAGEESRALARAIPASTGVAIGPVALDRASVERLAADGTAPVLVRAETVTDDVAALALSAGVLTRAGGRTSHAAVVARELGKPCLVGCAELQIDLEARTVTIGGRALAEGDVICLDAESGLVYGGAPEVREERPAEALAEVERWRQATAAPVAAGDRG